MYRKKKRSMISFWFYLFLGGFIFGIFLMNAGWEVLLTEEGLFAASDINRLKYLDIDGGKFFPYVLKKRAESILIPVLLSTTVLSCIVVYGYLIWQGMLMGMMLTAALIRFGLKGVLLVAAGVFPHQLLLFPAMVMVLIWCHDRQQSNRYSSGAKLYYMQKAVSVLWICFMLLTGCILESYVNPILVSEVLKIF